MVKKNIACVTHGPPRPWCPSVCHSMVKKILNQFTHPHPHPRYKIADGQGAARWGILCQQMQFLLVHTTLCRHSLVEVSLAGYSRHQAAEAGPSQLAPEEE